jgi:hypothetical protein
MEQAALYELARQVRSGMESFSSGESSPISLLGNYFPSSCCEAASMILAAYLVEQGLPMALRVHGINGGDTMELKSHVWLSLEGYVIDITADQFKAYGLAGIIVSKSSSFHDSFELVEPMKPVDVRTKFALDKMYLGKFEYTYQKVKAHIPG